ncbi:NAD(P)-binding protein [Metabacillus iocasae]|uniref:precorrin-2 dehydrogenase n=1 Tax=Priestia iocasae TaxID=2291674 RepID=A0ABS2R0C3_9BACI|nr:NAD(P)-binding protein [Metabacillus iocasae]MBM7704667.1 precorrin-2 dehydrogenase/sirohydrochlorin ferrochelatase [Metabacillus iocasae]
MYAVMIDLTHKNIVIVGGGSVATRKVQSLLKERAYITVIAPWFTEELLELEQERKVQLIRKEVEKRDIEAAFLIIVATNHSQVNEAIVKCASPSQLVNVVEKPENGNITFPAQFSRGKLSIAVSTNGASPLLAKGLIKNLKEQYDDSYEQYMDFLYECRSIIKHSTFDAKRKRQLLQKALRDEYRHSLTLQTEFIQELQQVSLL